MTLRRGCSSFWGLMFKFVHSICVFVLSGLNCPNWCISVSFLVSGVFSKFFFLGRVSLQAVNWSYQEGEDITYHVTETLNTYRH